MQLNINDSLNHDYIFESPDFVSNSEDYSYLTAKENILKFQNLSIGEKKNAILRSIFVQFMYQKWIPFIFKVLFYLSERMAEKEEVREKRERFCS